MLLPLTGDVVTGLPGQDFWTFGRTRARCGRSLIRRGQQVPSFARAAAGGPSDPCAQGKPPVALEVHMAEQFAAFEIGVATFVAACLATGGRYGTSWDNEVDGAA
ncbi:MAG: hypothetical protein H0W08_26925 [Acidobacteria bacterium]|nr:hypothetical protein [Acidobacteriota bacterium]